MAVNQINLQISEREAPSSYRTLGTIAMLAAPMMLVEVILFGLLYPEASRNNQLVGVLEVIYIGGWMCSAIAMRRLRVTGDGLLAQVVFIVQLTGLLLAAAFAVNDLFNANPDTNTLFFRVTDAAWPLSHVFMLVVGGLVMYAKRWRGWQRFAPLLCGLALPSFFVAGALGLREAGGFLFGLFTALGFMLLGAAVRASSPRNMAAAGARQ